MSRISYTNIAGGRAVCSCTPYDECNMECSLYRKIMGKQTNADHIRAMSDEELAVFFEELLTHCGSDLCHGCPMYVCCFDKGVTDWLKSPVEVE